MYLGIPMMLGGRKEIDQGIKEVELQACKIQEIKGRWTDGIWYGIGVTKRNETKRKARDPSISVDRLIR
jgi:hypothetical protein